ncbi:MAG: flagellar hook protein FlgE [Thermodesulfobacteriota bacterium]|nr:flagellar hook protein FlgE [Thermodesulfobacteriota bacterium]
MIGSLYAGISGLNANATAMTVIGDNIANVNTTAFKSNRSSFANVLSQSLQGSGGNDIGRGVAFWGASPSWGQGTVENTANPTDMAINGRGFFMVNDDSGQTFYSRAGEFAFDRNGDLRNPDGLAVQGYEVTAVAPDGTLTLGAITDIGVPSESTSPPVATDEFTMDINLDAGAAVGDTYSTSQVFYDSLGNAVPVTYTFTNTGPNAWTVGASVPATAGGPVTINGLATIPVTFDAFGNMTAPGADATVSIALTNGADTPQVVNWDLYDAAATSLGDITGYASTSVTTFQTQNGYPAGSLRGVSVDESGIVTGAYSNGQMTPLYQVALADFPSYYGLSKMGNNLYAETLASGQALPGIATSGRLGSISPSAVEMSNVDLSQEFVKMITTQRAYQANSRVITTSDEILNELINIKR